SFRHIKYFFLKAKMESNKDEIERWLMLHKWNPSEDRALISLKYRLKDRALFTATYLDSIVFFGIILTGDVPRFFTDWGGECSDKFSCYLQTRMINEHCQTVTCILTKTSQLIVYLINALNVRTRVEEYYNNPENIYEEETEYL